MATELETSQHSLRDDGYTCHWPRRRLRGHINFGPRFDEAVIKVTRNDGADSASFSLYYRLYNPSSINSSESPPLIVIHGGPSLPSDYLYPLIHHFPTSRSIIFYDQLGCGRSSQPDDGRMYSIENSVNDLEELINSLQLKEFHLLGHSFGGIIAYEYLKSYDLRSGCSKCLSLVLDSTPANMQTSLNECSRLECEIKSELMLEINDAQVAMNLVQDRLRKRNECRTEVLPHALATAIQSRGTTFGPESVADYVAYPPSKLSLPPVLLIRGQFDFITEKCIAEWREIFTSAQAYREEEMMNCAHYCHLEDAQRFGDLIKSHCFINDY
ncbi:hypothetical protein ACHAXH_008656 [Discostella pseudostelligera]